MRHTRAWDLDQAKDQVGARADPRAWPPRPGVRPSDAMTATAWDAATRQRINAKLHAGGFKNSKGSLWPQTSTDNKV